MSKKSVKRTKRNHKKTRRNKTINLELCPRCKKPMIKHTNMCPYCGNPLIEDIHKCPYCKMYIHGTKKGGSGCGPFGCPIAPLSWQAMNKIGGTNICGTKNVMSKYNGGSNMNIPGPFIGSPWTGNIANWPGINGIGSDKNYFELNKYEPDISRQMELNDTKIGGKRRRKTMRKKYKGGTSIIKDDLVNLGQNIAYNFKSVYNTLNGYQSPVNPTPYKGHFLHK
jgi:hypothetical protein